jgi:hypothetical protein
MLMPMSATSPYTVNFELTGVSDRGAEVHVQPDAAERGRVAAWLGVPEVPRLEATIRLERLSDGLYGYEAAYTAEVVQACVVTLEPVHSVHSETVSRRYRVAPRTSGRRASREPDVEVAAEGDDETPEVLSGTLIDLAAPLLEELSLGLDPYPRAPGVTFDPPKDEPDPKETPFAVLAKLKQRPPGKPEPRK